MDDFKIRILLEKAGNGDKQAIEELGNIARASDKATAAVKAHGEAAGATGELVENFGRKGGHAREAYEGLEHVMQGGPRSIFGLATAWRALTGAMAENPFTALAVVAVALVPLIEKIGEAFGGTAEKAKEMQKEMDAAADHAKQRVEAIDKLKFDALHAQLDLTRQKGKDALQMLEAVAAASEKIAASKDSADIAAIKANPKLTEEQKATQIAAIEQGGRERRRAGGLDKLDAEDANAAKDADDAKKAATQAAIEARRGPARVAAREREITANEAAIKAAQEAAARRIYATGVTPVDNSAADAADKALPDLLEKRETLNTKLAGEQRGSQLLKAEAAAAQKAAQKAADEAAQKRGLSDQERLAITGAGTFEDQKAATETTVEMRSAREKDEQAAARNTLDQGVKKGSLTLGQEDAVTRRAIELHKQALAQDGVQVGETIGGAVAAALAEIVPALGPAIDKTVKAAIDRAVRDLNGKINNLGDSAH